MGGVERLGPGKSYKGGALSPLLYHHYEFSSIQAAIASNK